MKLKYLLIPAMFLFAGCSMNDLSIGSNNTCNTEPSWVLNPPVDKSAIYGIGIAPENFKGEQAQRKSAVGKAIDEIASQLKTTVNSQTIIQASTHNKEGSTSMNSVSFQTVNGQKVSARIIKSCKNPKTGYLYILMEAKK